MGRMPVEVTLLFADDDKAWCTILLNHLSSLKHEQLISLWDRSQVMAGADHEAVISEHLMHASVLLLLVSAAFLASHDPEWQRALWRRQSNKALVVPILLQPVDWQSTPLACLQPLPTNGQPITLWSNQEAAFADVVKGIRAVLSKVEGLRENTSALGAFPLVWNIPYSRNPFFTGQEEVLGQLTNALKAGQATALSQPLAISGLGGIGKTQIAIEYAYQHRRDYQTVFWTLADTREALVSGYGAIAQLLKLAEKDAQEEQIITEAVKSWLHTHHSWLLILDNADEPRLIREFLPVIFGGHVLLTTRAQAMGKLANRIEVETMREDVGALLLLRCATLLGPHALIKDARAADVETAKTICKELGGLPLALDQAGAFIEESRCSLSDYLGLYQTQRAALLSLRGGLVSDHREPVATTWLISFEQVEERDPAAADLLRFCAFVHPDAIPEEMITRHASHLGLDLQQAVRDPLLFQKAIATLLAYSLIRRHGGEKTLSLHRLVQAVLSDAMDQQTRIDWKERAVFVVSAACPDVADVKQWDECEQWLPHALVCATWIEQEQMKSESAALLLNEAGYYLRRRARSLEAETLLMSALRIYEEQWGSMHPYTARSLNNLASLYDNQGRYEEAEALLMRALLIREEQLGSTHPHTASSLNNLASLYNHQGRYEEAEALLMRALSIREEQLGSTHPHTAMSLSNLAKIGIRHRKYSEAELLLRRALPIFEEQLGVSHPHTATALSILADLYQAQGRGVEAEPLLRRALFIYEQMLGQDHPDTQTVRVNYARLLEMMRGEKGEQK